MKSKFFISAIAGLCAAMILFSCEGGDPGAGGSSPSKPKKEKTEKLKPLSISIYLDNSSSMRGYYAPKTGSAAELTNILAAIKTKYPTQPFRAFYTQKGTKGTEVKEYDYKELSTQLSTKKIGYTDAYQLDQFITAIYKQTKADAEHSTMNFFFTDGILSGSDADIHSNPEYNKVNRANLRNYIADAIRPLVNIGYGVAMFQFNVDFNGTYYDYRNRQSQFAGKRPIYVLVIGPTSKVTEFASQAQTGSLKDFNPAHTLVITKSTADIVPNVSTCKRKGDTYTATPKKANVKGQKASLRVTFPLDKLPTYMADEEAVRNAVILTVNGKAVPASSIKLNGDKVVIPIEIKYGNTNFTLQVKDTLPGWVEQASAADDSSIAATKTQTFNLSTLVDGFCQGVSGSSTTDIVAPKTYTIEWDGETE